MLNISQHRIDIGLGFLLLVLLLYRVYSVWFVFVPRYRAEFLTLGDAWLRLYEMNNAIFVFDLIFWPIVSFALLIRILLTARAGNQS